MLGEGTVPRLGAGAGAGPIGVRPRLRVSCTASRTGARLKLSTKASCVGPGVVRDAAVKRCGNVRCRMASSVVGHAVIATGDPVVHERGEFGIAVRTAVTGVHYGLRDRRLARSRPAPWVWAASCCVRAVL